MSRPTKEEIQKKLTFEKCARLEAVQQLDGARKQLEQLEQQNIALNTENVNLNRIIVEQSKVIFGTEKR